MKYQNADAFLQLNGFSTLKYNELFYLSFPEFLQIFFPKSDKKSGLNSYFDEFRMILRFPTEAHSRAVNVPQV